MNTANVVYRKFDPNTLSTEGWLELGINQKTVETINKYLSKGGHFYKPEDLRKIWGMSAQKCEELIPFVKIIKQENSRGAKEFFIHKEKSVTKKSIFEINQADSLLILSLPGIGPALTHRILAYRQKLGGYFELNQLKEVWGLQDSVYHKIIESLKVDESLIQKININTIGIEQLKIHPYFGYKIGGIIINFRNQHGSFKSLEDIQKITLISEEIFNKIKHYLVVQ